MQVPSSQALLPPSLPTAPPACLRSRASWTPWNPFNDSDHLPPLSSQPLPLSSCILLPLSWREACVLHSKGWGLMAPVLSQLRLWGSLSLGLPSPSLPTVTDEPHAPQVQAFTLHLSHIWDPLSPGEFPFFPLALKQCVLITPSLLL